MRRLLRFGGGLLLILAAAGGLGALYLVLRFPQVALAPTLTIHGSPQLLTRGEYLFHHVTACGYCHSSRDWSTATGTILPHTEGMGGERFGVAEGVPGAIYASNITPAGLKDWSDGEIWRCLVSGVDRSGRALFPMMPYTHYRNLCTDDLQALIIFLRTLPAVENRVPEDHLLFPMNLLVRTLPGDAVPPSHAPAPDATREYGRYLVDAAACAACHSPMHHGRELRGQEFSGGTIFPMGTCQVRSANLTPDPSGLGAWTRAAFIERFQHGPEAQHLALGYATPMPWDAYQGMTASDLGAIYEYLHALPPVAHAVVKVTPDTQ
jgi:hypothetical protein